MTDFGMQRTADLAAAVDTAAEALATLLDPSRYEQIPRVSPTQLRVLVLLRAKPATNVNGLADAFDVGASSASRLCDRLEALGLLRRVSDPRDRREVRLLLTPAAVEMLDELDGYRRQALETVLARMPEAARRELVRSLTAFSAAADALAGEVADVMEGRTRRTA